MVSQSARENILVVENNLEDRVFIARQALQPLGYQLKSTELASTGIQLALSYSPDILFTNLHLPDLSGKDLLVALRSQGMDIPVILIANEGQENEVIQAFRLGASDYISKPLREAEIVSAAERALKSVRAGAERRQLAQKLAATNEALQNRVRELTTIFSIGKAVTSTTNQKTLYKIIVDGAVQVTKAHRGYILTRAEHGGFILSAYRNLPQSLAGFLDRQLDDGISSLVALSGEALSMHGQALKRFKVSQLGQAVLVVPIQAQKETIGLLVVLRKDDRAFNKSQQALLEAVADYASISMANARLFQALEERVRSLQQGLEDAAQAPRG